ncbi:probable serine/threonine-protein kinase nek3 isoform X2 [Teleopsis dalmanni]|uniref:probable serine/threonine-protein kinase nek3 isoform X2 n=1 Tax=Teleopsis dalmanni TaxID=139649 RepID=UPI0018CEA7DD|nr:probable serine/threonine-protein kinase nek3 isoform X2 [Teleopsis dalmanni]
MSLNGDVTVMRNGRTTSQISIYNYPEHLNPFYEDDQHRRLRFWSSSKKGDGERRNSFSVSGLKDLWSFKSFRKKRSSTLGINKTSESPPPLRRTLQYSDGPAYNPRSRYSANNNTNGAIDNNNFLRNATYRSSLQNVHTTSKNNTNNGFGLQRNDQYRSTMQYPSSSGRNQLSATMPSTPQRSSSQISVNTNPFETDDEEINENVSIDERKLVTSTPVKQTPRKKRRAPPPPVLVHNLTSSDHNNFSTNSSQQKNELHIEEDINIANLAAEIESFVQTSNNTTEEKKLENSTNHVVATYKTANDKVTNGTTPKDVKTESNNVIITTTTAAIATEATTTPTVAATTTTATEKADATTAIATAPTATTTATAAKTTSTTTTTTKTIETSNRSNGNSPIVKQKTSAQVVSPVVTKKETIRKVTEINISEKEPYIQEPTVGQNTSKKEKEVGHVECIHIHVDSPRATPERTETNKFSSFRSESKPEVEKITAKTSFTLTTPPVTRRHSETKTSDNTERRTPTAARRNIIPIATTQTTIIEKPIELVITEKSKNDNNPGNNSHNPNNLPTLEPILLETTTTTTTVSAQTTKSQVKPPIATKPNLEVKQKNNTFAMIHKPNRTTLPNGHVSPTKTSVTETVLSVNMETKPDINEIKAPEIHVQKIETEQCVERNQQIQPENTSSAIEPLKIIESKENILENNETVNVAVTNKVSTFGTRPPTPPTRHVPLRAGLTNDEFEAIVRAKPTSHMEWKQSSLAPLETNVPPEKRKSVKDIIESINRSQRLLHAAANKDQMPILSPDNGLNSNLETLYKDYKHINPSDQVYRQYELETGTNTTNNFNYNNTSNCEGATGSSSNSTAPITQNDPLKPSNADIFTKCRVTKEVYEYRESSPTASNLDWNPVPKPKRTKNLSELQSNEE